MLDDVSAARPPATPQRRRLRRARLLGAAAMALCALCAALIVVLGLLGPSAAEPWFGPAGKAPPWFVRAHPQDLLVYVLVALVLLLGAAAVVAGIAAARRGWSPSPARLLLGSGAAVAALTCVPPLGTTDPLNYAAYGRMAVLGLDPYRTTPWQLARAGDPVGKVAVAEPWLHVPSVYGPLVAGTQWAAAALGGPSTQRVVWLLSLLSAAAFLGVGALLLRLAGPDPGRRVRTQLLWSLNPVLWWNLIVGQHVDVLGAFLVACALLALRRSPVVAGLALGAAAAVKPTLGALVVPLAWSLRRDRRSLVRAVVAALAVAATGYALALDALRNAADVSERVTIGTAWILGEQHVLVPAFGTPGARTATTVLELLLMAVLAALLLRALPPVQENDLVRSTARTMLALVAAYLLTTAYVRPWYDCVAWVLLALLPRSWFDLVLLAHTTLLTLPFDPGRPVTLHPHGLGRVAFEVGYRLVPVLQAALVALVVCVCLRRIYHRPPLDTRHHPLRQ
ncbi:glycosyltransferase 87 family protein [Streptacidiphilus neutrinimicus]|uniref:glycosyltransferase 87 family protein n=1 Tax=Streptacidiphilus neutrinimicus TaxID=105420 RepID=UPI0005A98FA3|nr:glycosyltransferase 87 family protein [Streptacidiphilus neutrinimicus]